MAGISLNLPCLASSRAAWFLNVRPTSRSVASAVAVFRSGAVWLSGGAAPRAEFAAAVFLFSSASDSDSEARARARTYDSCSILVELVSRFGTKTGTLRARFGSRSGIFPVLGPKLGPVSGPVTGCFSSCFPFWVPSWDPLRENVFTAASIFSLNLHTRIKPPSSSRKCMSNSTSRCFFTRSG